MDDSFKNVLKITHEIETIIKSNPPDKNENSLKRVQFLCIQMKGVDSYINSKASKVSRLSSEYFSVRKHNKYPGGSDQLQTDITFDFLDRIRCQIRYLDSQK